MTTQPTSVAPLTSATAYEPGTTPGSFGVLAQSEPPPSSLVLGIPIPQLTCQSEQVTAVGITTEATDLFVSDSVPSLPTNAASAEEPSASAGHDPILAIPDAVDEVPAAINAPPLEPPLVPPPGIRGAKESEPLSAGDKRLKGMRVTAKYVS